MERHSIMKLSGTIALIAVVVGAAITAPTATSAGLAVSDFQVNDKDTTLTPGQNVSEVRVDVSGALNWDSSHALDKYELTLAVSVDGDNYEQISSKTKSNINKSGSRSYTLTGNVLDHSGLTTNNFDPGTGVTYKNDLWVRVSLQLYRNGKVVQTVNKSDMGTLKITREELVVNGDLSGTGSFDVATS